MLKRQQVLIEDWMVDYLKYLTDIYDLSYSEIVRLGLCAGISHMIKLIHPEYKPGITIKEAFKKIKKASASRDAREQLHKVLSLAYYETHKAIEYRLSKEKAKKRT
jgi:hypothetical protein